MLSTHYSCHMLMKVEFSVQIFEKCTNSNFYENLFSGNRIVPSGRTDKHTDRHAGRWTDGRKDGQTDMTDIIVAFRDFAKRI